MKPPTPRERAQTTVAFIRAEYPNPTCAENHDPSDYCVGRAVWLYTGRPCDFPDSPLAGWGRVEIASALRVLNPTLSESSSLQWTYKISNANDEGNFEAAYSDMVDALSESCT